MKKLGLLLLAVMMISLSSCGESADKAKDAANNAVEATKDAAKDAGEAVKEGAEKAVDAAKDAGEAVKEGAEKAVDAAKDAVAAKVDGKTLFMENGCVACHNADKKTVGPAIKEIAKGYAGKKADLVKFLKGEGKAIIDPAQFAVMQPNLNTTKGMNDDQLNALADYLLSFK